MTTPNGHAGTALALSSFTDTTPVAITPPAPPALWLIWCDGDDEHPGHWLTSIDDARGGPTYLVSFAGEEALAACAHQEELYGHPCRPVRVK